MSHDNLGFTSSTVSVRRRTHQERFLNMKAQTNAHVCACVYNIEKKFKLSYVRYCIL